MHQIEIVHLLIFFLVVDSIEVPTLIRSNVRCM